MTVLNDLHCALRGLARSKLTSAVLLFSLALGTGANATLFSVMDALLFRPPPGVVFARQLTWVFTSQFTGAAHGLTSYPDFLSLRDGAGGAFAALAAFDDSAVESVRLGDAMQRVRIAAVSPEFFPTLGMELQAGSFAAPPAAVAESSGPGVPLPPAIISDGLWTALGRPADLIGRELRIGDSPYVIAGVAPAGFNGLQLGRACDVWTPLALPAGETTRGDRRLSVLGRLRAGRSLADAEAQVHLAGERLAALHPETNRGTRTNPDEPRQMSAASYSRLDPSARSQVLLISTVVLGSTVLLLVSACVNAGSLLLSRSASRRRELAVKLALGASRAMLVRQVLLESVAVSVGGAALGLLFARWTAGVLPAFFAPEEAAMLDTRLDAVTVAVTIALSCVAGALFAFGPARHAMQKVNVLVLRGDCRGHLRSVGQHLARGGRGVSGRAVDRAADRQRRDGAGAGRGARGRSRTGRTWCRRLARANARRAAGRCRPWHRVPRGRGRCRAQAAPRRGRGLGLDPAGRPQRGRGLSPPGDPATGRAPRGRSQRRLVRVLPGAAHSADRGPLVQCRRRRARQAGHHRQRHAGAALLRCRCGRPPAAGCEGQRTTRLSAWSVPGSTGRCRRRPSRWSISHSRSGTRVHAPGGADRERGGSGCRRACLRC